MTDNSERMAQHTPQFADPADRPAASYRTNMAAEIDTLEDVLAEFIDEEIEGEVVTFLEGTREMTPGVRRVVVAIAAGALRKADDRGVIQELFGYTAPTTKSDLAEFANKLMEVIDSDRNPRLEAKCVDFVFGLGLTGGKTQTVIAGEEGVGKAAVSKRCRNLVKKFPERFPAEPNRAPARGMKTEDACKTYAARQTGKQARPPREPWAFMGMLSRVLGGANVAPGIA